MGKQEKAKVGNFSAKIKGDEGKNSSFFHKHNLNVVNFTKLKVQFWYFTKNMKSGRDKFVLEYTSNGGDTWIIIQVLKMGIDFLDRKHAFFEGVLDENFTEFTNKVRLRFRCKGRSSLKASVF